MDYGAQRRLGSEGDEREAREEARIASVRGTLENLSASIAALSLPEGSSPEPFGREPGLSRSATPSEPPPPEKAAASPIARAAAATTRGHAPGAAARARPRPSPCSAATSAVAVPQAHLEDTRAPSAERDLIFSEVLPKSRELATDVFGNFVVQKVLTRRRGHEVKVYEALKGHCVALSLHVYGCRVVQKALDALPPREALAVIGEFSESVLLCVHDQNGNHVIQKCVEATSKATKLVKNGALRDGDDAALERDYAAFGESRVLEHCGPEHTGPLLDELQLADLPPLIEDQYANYVMQHAIQYGRHSDKAKLLAAVKANLLDFSRHKFASNVVEKCLDFGSEETRSRSSAPSSAVGADHSPTSALKLLIVDPSRTTSSRRSWTSRTTRRWRKFLTLEERTSIREKIAAAYKQCESFDDLLETVAAMQEELVHISAPSRLDYFKTGCQFDRLVQNKRELMGKVEGGDQKRTKCGGDRQSSGGVTVSQDCDSQECELTQEAILVGPVPSCGPPLPTARFPAASRRARVPAGLSA
ncbi:hypothetical protein JL720_9594 [Aureococcus anophagefferens]|nr:hypothetical protein JL720_9594 [Aureococcus anophagefferens]